MHIIPHICRGYGDRKVKSNRCSPRTWSVYLSAPRKCFVTNLTPGSCIHLSLSTLSFDSLAANLRHCSNVGSLLNGREIHAHIQKCGHFHDTFLGNCLIHMYGSCESLEEANYVFEKMHRPNVFTWNIMIKAYVQDGNLDGAYVLFEKMPQKDGVSWNTMMSAFVQNQQDMSAVYLFNRMLLECVLPDKISLLCILDACSKVEYVEQGLIIHVFIVNEGYDQNMAVSTALSNMHGKCANLRLAMIVFERMQDPPDVIAWSTIISIFVHNGQMTEALDLFFKMWFAGMISNTSSFIAGLDACADLMAIEVGREIHLSIVIETNLESDISLLNTLISMYGKCGYVHEATNIFNHAKDRDIISWNAFIACLIHNECCNEALRKFRQMQITKVIPDKVTFLCILDACAKVTSLIEGQEIHTIVTCVGLESETVVGTALVNMYGKCWQLEDAKLIFRKVQHRDMVCWNALIAVLSQNRNDDEALCLFHEMQSEGIVPDHISFICALESCSNLDKGYDLHKVITATGHDQYVEVSNALVCMYGRFSGLDDAKFAFTTLPLVTSASWNAMIGVLSRNGNSREALQLFLDMKHRGFHPDKISFVCVLDACASLEVLKSGQEIHSDIINVGYDDDNDKGGVTIKTALISMYGKCTSPCCAICVFESMFEPDIVAWNALFTALTQNGSHSCALYQLYQMQHKGVKPNQISFLCVLDACANLASLTNGMEVHAFVVESEVEKETVVGTAVINMYGKCGSVLEAKSTFEPLCPRDVISWNTMLALYAQNGQASEAMESFKRMLVEHIHPDEVTFVCLLTACSHAGCLDIGKYIFAHMNVGHRIPWMRDHYGCMVDLLGRAGMMDEAEALIHQMSLETGSVVWPSILSACRHHDDFDRGMRASKHCFERDSHSMASHLTLSSLILACEG